jgi:hypothetical protein
MRPISNKELKSKLEGIRIDTDNMAEDLKQKRDAWPDRFEDSERLYLKELRTISTKINRLINRIK